MSQAQLINVVDSFVQNPYREFTETIPAGQSIDVRYDHNSLRILALTAGATLQVQFGQSGSKTSLVGAGMGFEYTDGEGRPIALRSVRLFNGGGAPLTVTVGAAIGKVADNRLTVSGTLTTIEVKAGTFDSLTDVALTNGSATQLDVSDASRRELIVTNVLANAVSMRVGDSGVSATNGIELQPGDSVALTTTAAVFAYIVGAGKFAAVTEIKD